MKTLTLLLYTFSFLVTARAEPRPKPKTARDGAPPSRLTMLSLGEVSRSALADNASIKAMRAKWEMMQARIPNKVRGVPGAAGSAAEPDAGQVAREAEYRELRRKLWIAAALSAPVLVNFVSVLIIACQRARVSGNFRPPTHEIMDSTEIFVVIAGIAAITFVLWYFFGERRRMAAAIGESGVQEIQVTLKGGYSPDLIVVREGVPVRLNFYRDETASCSDQIVFGIARDLPAYKGEGGRVHLHLRHADDARQTDRGSE